MRFVNNITTRRHARIVRATFTKDTTFGNRVWRTAVDAEETFLGYPIAKAPFLVRIRLRYSRSFERSLSRCGRPRQLRESELNASHANYSSSQEYYTARGVERNDDDGLEKKNWQLGRASRFAKVWTTPKADDKGKF